MHSNKNAGQLWSDTYSGTHLIFAHAPQFSAAHPILPLGVLVIHLVNRNLASCRQTIFFVYFFSQKNIEEKNIYCGEILHTGKGVLDWPSHLPRGPINAGVERTRVGLCKAGVFLRPNRVLSFPPPAHSRSAQLFHATIKLNFSTTPSPPFLFLLRSSFHPPIRRFALQANRRRDLLRGWRMYGEGED